MFALIQSKTHVSNKGKTAGRYQFDTHPTGIGLNRCCTVVTKVIFSFRETSNTTLVATSSVQSRKKVDFLFREIC